MIGILGTQKKLKKIMALSKPEREIQLRELAQSFGCSQSFSYTNEGKHDEAEIVRRIQEAARSHRESRLWMVALISAIASLFVALSAWWAVAS